MHVERDTVSFCHVLLRNLHPRRVSLEWRRSRSPYLGGVVVGALVALPAASVDPGDARQTQLALIDLEGLVFHHAPSSQSCLQSANIPLTARSWEPATTKSLSEFAESKYWPFAHRGLELEQQH